MTPAVQAAGEALPRAREPAATDDSGTGAIQRPWVGWALLAGAIGVAARFCYLSRSFELDDALIYQRYVRNALAGNGLVYNPGEAWNALTSPLFTYLSIAAAWLAGDVRRGAIVLAATATIAAIGVFYALFSRHLRPACAALGALLLASSPYLYSTLRMETPLFVVLIGLCLLLAEEDRTFWLGIACALLILTRSEGIFLVAALALRHFAEGRRFPRWRDFVLPGLLIGAVLLSNWRLYGRLLPDTLGAKIDQGRSGLWGERPIFLDVGYQLQWFFEDDRALPMVLGAAAIVGLMTFRTRPLIWMSLLFLGQLALFYAALNVPNYHWYYAPFYALGFFLAATGWEGALGQVARLRSGGARFVLTGLLIALAALVVVRQFRANETSLAAATVESPYRRIGLWLRDNAPRDARFASAEVGVLGWYSELRAIDMVGLVSPENSRFLGERRFAAWLERATPDYAVLHDPAWPIERAVVDAAERGRFVREPALQEAGFQLYRSTGLAAQDPIAELLKRWRGRASGGERAATASAIFEQGLYDPRKIPGTEMLAVRVTADLWSQGTAEAGVAVHNADSVERVARLRLACMANAADLPIAVYVDDGRVTVPHTFSNPGFLELDLGRIEPGGYALFILWTDKAWTPGAKDPRELGVKMFAPKRSDSR